MSHRHQADPQRPPQPRALRRTAGIGLLALAASLAAPADQTPPPLNRAPAGELQSGFVQGQLRTWQVVDGLAVTEGDLILGASPEPDGARPGNRRQRREPGAEPEAIGFAYPGFRWPKVGAQFQIPYVASSGNANLDTALSRFNASFSGLIQWVPRTGETDYVDIQVDPDDRSGSGRSWLGRVGGAQALHCSIDCTVGTFLHEMGHATGLYHEHSRSDRDSYLSVLTQNLIKSVRALAFDPIGENAQDLGSYDYASLMHYPAFVDSKNGDPVLESIPAGIPLGLGSAGGYSAGDLDGIRRLYGAVPARVTVTTNPAGLKLIVDGATVTAPQTFDWAIGSAHTLAIPSGAQTLGGSGYTYGRWSDDPQSSHGITVAAGRGFVTEPASAPRTTVYSANFIQLVPYSQSVQGSGTMSASPAAQAYPPLAGLWYRARQGVTFTAAPGAGSRFYQFLNRPYFLPGALSANPKTFVVPDDGVNAVNVTAQFTSTPVTTIASDPAGLPVLVDGGYWIAPKNFSSAYDFNWAAGSTHALDVYSPAYPYSSTIRYALKTWSDGGAKAHSFTVPAAGGTRTASFTPQFQATYTLNSGCAGSVGMAPAAPLGDGFYDRGTLLTFTQTPNPGWTFARWLGDLAGSTSPQTLTVNDEPLVEADYNTVATPFVLSALQPAAATRGSSGLTLTLLGSGFTPATDVFVNNQYRSQTFIDSGRMTVSLTAADLATAGAFQVFIQNYPPAGGCIVYAVKSFTVANSPTLSATPGLLAFGSLAVSTTSAVKTTTLRNTGSRALNLASISASGAYTLTHSCPASLAVNASCKLSVSFAPTATGATLGAVTVADDAVDAPHVVSLTGTGVAPMTVSPASLAFASQALGSTSAAKTVTLTNNLATPLNLSFSAGAPFSAVTGGATPCAASLAAKSKCTLAVSFQPQITGTAAGALNLGYNAAFSPLAVKLGGTGGSGSNAPLAFSPTSLSFAATAIGATSAPRTVTATNTGAASASLSGLAASAGFTATGSGAKPCAGALAAGAACTFDVRFSPTAAGTLVGAVRLANGINAGPQTFAVSGVGVLPVTLAPASLVFAAQAIGTRSSPQSVTVTNNQSAALTLGGIVTSGQYAIGANTCGSSLPVFGTCTFGISFAPTILGNVSGAVTVAHGAAYGPQVLMVSGEGR